MIDLKSGYNIPIVEIFNTVQGEGRFVGHPVCFIRTAGCDVGCVWCDTKYSWDINKHSMMSMDDILNKVKTDIEILVISGGEPLIWNLDKLCDTFKKNDKKLHLETSGAYKISGSWDWITLSPKRNKMPVQNLYKKANELKIVIDHKEDFKFAEECRKKVGLDCLLYLQPQWNRRKKTLPYILDYIKDNSHWSLSLQMHKMINIK